MTSIDVKIANRTTVMFDDPRDVRDLKRLANIALDKYLSEAARDGHSLNYVYFNTQGELSHAYALALYLVDRIPDQSC